MDIDTINTSTNITRDTIDIVAPGPMTRARVRQINDQVPSLLCTYSLTNENMKLHSCVNFLVLRGESDRELEDENHSVLNLQAVVLIACTGSTEQSIMHATSTTNKCKRSKEGLDFMDQNRPRVPGYFWLLRKYTPAHCINWIRPYLKESTLDTTARSTDRQPRRRIQ